jgi:hypothetical protein
MKKTAGFVAMFRAKACNALKISADRRLHFAGRSRNLCSPRAEDTAGCYHNQLREIQEVIDSHAGAVCIRQPNNKSRLMWDSDSDVGRNGILRRWGNGKIG